MHYLLFEDDSRLDLLPLTFTRPVWDLRCGILTVREKWARHLEVPLDALWTLVAEPYLQARFQQVDATAGDLVAVNAKLLPDGNSRNWLRRLPANSYVQNAAGELLALRTDAGWLAEQTGTLSVRLAADRLERVDLPLPADLPALRFPWDVFRLNHAQIKADFHVLTAGRQSQPLDDPHTAVYNSRNVFLEPGAQVRAAILNAEKGPIYLGAGAEVQEGAILTGAHAVLDHAVVNVGAKLRGDTTVGPHCKVGGEVSNSVFWGYSNKGHDGFVGNSVIGQWCNLGADTNTSNLKNNYSEVKVYSHRHHRMVDTGLTFCGLTMGDHAKCGINTMFNTGTVVGVFANIFGGGFPDKFVPSFAWGATRESKEEAEDGSTFLLDKAFEVAERVMARREVAFTDEDRRILSAVLARTR